MSELSAPQQPRDALRHELQRADPPGLGDLASAADGSGDGRVAERGEFQGVVRARAD